MSPWAFRCMARGAALMALVLAAVPLARVRPAVSREQQISKESLPQHGMYWSAVHTLEPIISPMEPSAISTRALDPSSTVQGFEQAPTVASAHTLTPSSAAMPEPTPKPRILMRDCIVFEMWRKSYGGAADVILNLGGLNYGDPVDSWEDCVKLCVGTEECMQVVFQRVTHACYPTSIAGDDDLDEKGGVNADFISAHCHKAETATEDVGVHPTLASPPPNTVSDTPTRPSPPLSSHDDPTPPLRRTANPPLLLGSPLLKNTGETSGSSSGDTLSLFCFSLVVPWTDEPALLETQLEKHQGIFACDESTVYSNPAGQLGSVQAKLVDIDLHCERGGAWDTWINTPIFVKLWATVLEDGQFRHHDWTAKADPDTVFMPDRLRATLQLPDFQDAQDGNGQVINNCFLGMHGALEIISRRALEVYEEGYEICGQPPEEDVFIRSCLESLGVSTKDQFDTLEEQDCARDDVVQSPDWWDCTSGAAAYHPFKSPQNYSDCLERALQA